MKILMINSVSGFGSTGSICVDIALELESQGHECFIAYGQVSNGYKKVFKIGSRLENHLHNLGSRIFGKQGYFTKNGTKKLVAFIENYSPDVIHLHNLHGNYLNLEILFNYLIKVQKPVVWTLHDCWAYTGKCAHYTNVQCFKWKNECGNCPQLDKYPPSIFLDYSKEMFNDKKKMVQGLKNLTIIPVSHWLESQVQESFLNSFSIKTIYNWVDHSTFKPSATSDVEIEYNLKTDKFNILLVSAGWHEKDNKFCDAVELAKLISEDIQIIMVGHLNNAATLPENIIHIPYTGGKQKLAELYSYADVYIHLSTEDSFGKVIAEAMSCGTPVIVYNSTACPELVGENCGFIVEPRKLSEIVNKLKSIKASKKEVFSASCRQYVLNNFDQRANVQATINIYKEVIH